MPESSCAVVVQRADVFGDRHLIVVQHHQHIRVDVAGVVHRFERHTGGDGAIADHTHRAAAFAFTLRCHRHAETGADRGRRVADRQHVVFAFGAPREGMQAVLLPNGGDPVAAAGQNFVRVGPWPTSHTSDRTACCRRNATPPSVRRYPARRQSGRWSD